MAGIYTDTLINAGGCDTIVSLVLSVYELEGTGLEQSVAMTLGDTVSLAVNEGFVSYMWNNDPSLDKHTITVFTSELGEGSFNYTIEVEDPNGCIQHDTVELLISPSVGILSKDKPVFSVYPNPVSGNELNLEYSISAEASLVIYSQDGREVNRMILYPQNTFKRIQLPEAGGLYNLIMINKEGTAYTKVLKL